ncbi:TonB-dependent receptor [Novosphingobium sp.]|uniref:TonB-dependent receptor n=1 Tax=Novosphingobium sp. TaxID=1874826 RepID=UPI0025F422DC|nr:TonB-dependent receptor [Novosphingobium sp.]
MRGNFGRQALLTALATTAMVGTLTGFSAPALAQAAPAPAAADPAAAAPEEDANTIIVSARRRDETLQTTPIAITAINAAMLENKASVNIGDLQGAAPNLLITQQNSGAAAANLSIRGLTYADIEKSQTPTVGVVIDGVIIGTNTGQLADFFDIDQIEVLRGPQGTLFGANTIGGVINIRRSKPTMKTGIKAEASYGKFNTWSTRVVANVGNGDTLGLKAWFFHNETDGFLYNAIQKKPGGGSTDSNFGASLLWKPTGSGFEAQATIEKLHQTFDPTVSNLANSTEVFCAFEPANECNRNTRGDLYTVFTAPATSVYNAPSYTLEMNYNAGDVKLTSITGYKNSNEFQTQDFDASSADLYYVLRRQNYHQFTQELRAAGKISRTFDYVVGGFYFNSSYNLTQFSRVFGFAPTISPDVFDKNAQIVHGHTESYAAFADFNWAFADKFRLSFGGRITHDKKELTNSFATTGLVGSGNRGFSKFTPKIGIDYRPNNETMLYASFTRGYRSGGFSPRAATAATASTPFQPETVDSFEVGTKLDLLDRKLQLNFAGFYSKYKNLQQNTTIPGGPTGNQTITSNVGSADIKGVEFDGSLRVADGFKISATAAYLDSHFNNFIVGNVYTSPNGTPVANGGLIPFDYSANRLIYAPKFSGSINADYTLPTSFGSLVAATGVRHISTYDEQISLGTLTPVITAGKVTSIVVGGNDPRVRTATQNLWDASLTAKLKMNGGDAYITGFIRNILDNRTTSAAFTVAGLWSFGSAIQPRTYGVTVGVKF